MQKFWRCAFSLRKSSAMRSHNAKTLVSDAMPQCRPLSLEGLEYPEYVMHFLPKVFWNMLGNSLPVGSDQQTTENFPKIFGLSTIEEYVMHICLHKVCPGILQVIISNGLVISGRAEGDGAKVLGSVFGRRIFRRFLRIYFCYLWPEGRNPRVGTPQGASGKTGPLRGL